MAKTQKYLAVLVHPLSSTSDHTMSMLEYISKFQDLLTRDHSDYVYA